MLSAVKVVLKMLTVLIKMFSVNKVVLKMFTVLTKMFSVDKVVLKMFKKTVHSTQDSGVHWTIP